MSRAKAPIKQQVKVNSAFGYLTVGQVYVMETRENPKASVWFFGPNGSTFENKHNVQLALKNKQIEIIVNGDLK